MSIPALTTDGFLPPGIHECTLEEVAVRFGQFQRTDLRPHLFAELDRFSGAARETGFFAAIVLDGSFISSQDNPNDIDLILVFKSDHDLQAETRPFEYNVVSSKRVQRNFGFDALYAIEGSESLSEHVAFFSQVRDRRELKKGLLWLDIK